MLAGSFEGLRLQRGGAGWAGSLCVERGRGVLLKAAGRAERAALSLSKCCAERRRVVLHNVANGRSLKNVALCTLCRASLPERSTLF